jgi:hypothetical protein
MNMPTDIENKGINANGVDTTGYSNNRRIKYFGMR